MQWYISKILLVLLVLNGAVIGRALQPVHRISYGVSFSPVGDVHAAVNNWKHTFELILPNQVDSGPDVKSCHPRLTRCQVFRTLEENANRMRKSTLENVNKTLQDIYKLIPEGKFRSDKSRTTRSILPIIGDVAKSLFGVATEKEVKVLAQHIMQLKRKNDKVNSVFEHQMKNFASYMATQTKRVNLIVDEVQKSHEQIISLNDELVSMMHIMQASNKLLSQILSQTHVSVKLLSQLSALKISIGELVQGRLSPSLIPPQLLESVLIKIKENLEKTDPELKVAYPDPQHYYVFPKFIFVRNGGSIFITLNIPIASFHAALSIYKVEIFPVPINNTINHATRLANVNEYFAISSDRQYYSMFNFLHSHTFGDFNGYVRSLALIPIAHPSCLLALYFHIDQDIKSLCDFRYEEDAIKPTMIKLQDHQTLLINVSNVVVKCKDGTHIEQGCSYCVISVQCHCSLSTSNQYFPPRFEECHADQKISKYSPVNRALLQHYFDPSILKQLFHNINEGKDVKIKIPHFDFSSHNFSKFMVEDRKKQLNLKKMVLASKNNEKIFRTLSDKFAVEWSNLPQGATSYSNEILTYISLTFSTISLCFNIWILYKAKSLSASLLALSQIRKVDAVLPKIPQIVYGETQGLSTTTTSGVCSRDFGNRPDFHEIMLGLICILLIIRLFYGYFSSRSRQNTTQLLLEITTGNMCVMIPIHTLSLCPKNWHFQASTYFSDLYVTGILCPHLHVSWHDLRMTCAISKQSYFLASSVPVSIFMARRIRQILKQSFSAYLVLEHQGYAFHFVICPPNCVVCGEYMSTAPQANLYPSLSNCHDDQETVV